MIVHDNEPIAGTKGWTDRTGRTVWGFQVTLGSGKDSQSAGLRRMTVNATDWCLELEDQIDPESSLDYTGDDESIANRFHDERLNVIPQNPEAYR